MEQFKPEILTQEFPKSKTCCLSGNCNLSRWEIPLLQWRLKRALNKLIKKGYLYFGVGGSMGFDMLAEHLILQLREIHPEIKLILVLPCRDQAKSWNAPLLQEYEFLMRRADSVVCLADYYYPGCIQNRDHHLASHSSAVICHTSWRARGDIYTEKYAQKNSLRLLHV